MAQHVFLRLLFELQAFSGLVNTKFVSAEEKLAIFLHFARTGCSSRNLQERFQRSAETVTKYLSTSIYNWPPSDIRIDPSTPSLTVLLAAFIKNTSISPQMRPRTKSKAIRSSTHTFVTAVEQLMAPTSMRGFYPTLWPVTETGRGTLARMSSQHATSQCSLSIF
jgi:hypothetical protein